MLERTRKYNFIRLEACHYKIEGPEKRQNQEDTIYWFRTKINIRQHFLVTFLEIIEENKRIIQTVGDIERELLVGLKVQVLPGIVSTKEEALWFNGIKVRHYNCRCNIGSAMAVGS